MAKCLPMCQAAALLLWIIASCVKIVKAQYKAPSELFNELYANKQEELKELLERHPDLYHIYYPMQHSLPKDYYM